MNWNKITAVVVGTIGFVAACVTLYPWAITKICPEDGIALIQDSQQLLQVLNIDELDSPVLHPRIQIDKELVSQNHVKIVTNELVFKPEGKLIAPDITIFATRISGGELNVRGSDAQKPGATGGHAGTIFIGAATLKDTKIDASGGNGKKGGKGNNGSEGRDGRCTSRLLQGQRWIGATDGGHGSNGQNGGNGGNGGEVTLLLAMNEHPYQPEPNVNGGQPGEGGAGGKGGKGGKGCAGPGGIQASHPDGLDGSPGDPGIGGEPGTFVSRDVNFRNVKKILDDVNLSAPNELKTAMETILGE